MLPNAPSNWADLVDRFHWRVPDAFNMAEAVERNGPSNRAALIFDSGNGEPTEFTFSDLSRLSNRLANVLEGLDVGRGDRVAIFLPQRPEVALTHLAAWKIGAVSLPLTTLFGQQALIQRLGSGQPTVMVVELSNVALLQDDVFPDLEHPPHLLVVDSGIGTLPMQATSFERAISQASESR